MAALTMQDVVRAGIAPTYAAADVAGDNFVNDGRIMIHLKNTNAAVRNVTVITQMVVDGKAVADDLIAIPATTGDKMIGPFPPTIYNDVNGKVQLTYDAVTNLTIAVIRLPS